MKLVSMSPRGKHSEGIDEKRKVPLLLPLSPPPMALQAELERLTEKVLSLHASAEIIEEALPDKPGTVETVSTQAGVMKGSSAETELLKTSRTQGGVVTSRVASHAAVAAPKKTAQNILIAPKSGLNAKNAGTMSSGFSDG